MKKKFLQEQFEKHGKLNAKAFPGRAAILVKLLGLDQNLISAVYEKTGSFKVGHYLPGTRIPILSDDDLFTLIYTSGTTINPNGVMITHSNIISQISALKDTLDWGKNDRAISFLPLSHVFERMVEYFYMFKGVSIYYGSIENIGEDLKSIQKILLLVLYLTAAFKSNLRG